jgi:hypothetical protein
MFMKKLWIFLALVVLIATQIAVLSAFHPIVEHTVSDEAMTVVIAKLDYAHLQVKVSISAWESDALLVFSNGTQKQIPASSSYKFSVVMPSSGFSPGSSSFQADGISLSDKNPIDIAFFSNRTLTQVPYSNLNWVNEYSRVSVYCFTVQGQAGISVEGLGAGF